MPDRAEYDLSTRIIEGRRIVFDGEGFFWDPSQWSEGAAVVLAKELGVAELDEEQWSILRFLRKYYAENGRSPLNRQIREGTGISLMRMEGLFPGGIKYGARRLAGLPNPKGCV